MLSILLFLFMFFQEIYIDNLFGSILYIGGFPIGTWILYIFYFVVLINTLIYLVTQEDKRFYALSMLIFVAASIIITIYSSMEKSSIFSTLSNSVHYVIPILIYAYMYQMPNKRKNIYHYLTILVVTSGVLSVLFMSGLLRLIPFLNSNLISRLSRSSLIVDGGLGLIGFCVGLYSVVLNNEKVTKKQAILLIVFGMLIVISSQSRARIFAMLLSGVFLFFETKISRNETRGVWFKIGAAFTLLCLVIIVTMPEQVDTIYSQIVGRFSELGEDNSSIYRAYEYEQQLELFRENPLLGVGWNGMDGILVRDTYGDAQRINNHNMYSTILAIGGITFAGVYLLWFMGLMLSELKQYYYYDDVKLHLMILLIIGIMSVSSAGFNKTSMIIGVMIVYVDIIERLNDPAYDATQAVAYAQKYIVH